MTGFGDLQTPTRFGDTQYNEVDFASRLATMSNYSNFTHIAPQDLPKLKAHPQDEMIQRLVSARNRKIDSIIYNGLIGTAQRKTTEADTFTAVALPAEQQIGTSAAPVTFSKQLLIDIRTKFMENEVPDEEEIIVTYNSDMLNMILADSTLTSADYLQGQMLQRGEINTFLGFKWVPYQKIKATPASTYATGVAYTSKALKFGSASISPLKVVEREDKNRTISIGHIDSYGCVRTDEKRVVAFTFSV